MLLDVTTVDGSVMVVNTDHLVIAGAVADAGTPVVGVTKIMLLNGAALVIREGLVEFMERANAKATGKSVLL